MKLEPVYLVAPRPKPPSMPTRRAFFGMGLAFACGGAIGSACGYSVGSARAVDAAANKPPVAEELPKSGDPGLDEVRWLAVKAPIEELVAKAEAYLPSITFDYPNDEIAWQGVKRLSEYLLRNESMPNRRAMCGWVAQVIDGAAVIHQDNLKGFASKLREIR